MKKVLFSLPFFLMGLVAQAQAYYGSGDQKLQVGVVPYGYGFGFSGSYDYGIVDLFSAGIGTELYLDEHGEDKKRNFYLFARGNVHLGDLLGLPLSMDLYPGADIGITGDGIGYSFYGGLRYFFSERFGVFAEIGTHGRAGLSIAF